MGGDLSACVAALDGLRVTSQADLREAVLLRSRVLLRRHQPAEVVALLGPALKTFVGVDEEATGRMLHAVAVARAVSAERGLELLLDLRDAALGGRAHPTIQAEIAYWIAYVHWLRRDFAAAAQSAGVAEAAKADVVSVRAASLRGFVAVASERYADALRLFQWALAAYGDCRERDSDLLERIVVQIASLEVTLRGANVRGTHVERRPEPSNGHVPGVFRMQIAALDAWLFAFDGDQANAYRHVRRAEDLAPAPAWRVWALANRANLAIVFDERAIGHEFAAQALELVDAVDWNATADEERVGLLFLAEALAVTSPFAALGVWTRYRTLTSEIDESLVYHRDIRLWIIESTVRGLVHRILGEYADARAAFAAVSEHALRVGNLWRAANALIELDATPAGAPAAGRARGGGEPPLEAAARLVHENFPNSFLARRLGRWANVAVDSNVARLTRVPRHVLRHLLDGKSAKEIAAIMGISPGTVKNYVNAILREFGVRSTPQLLVTCYRRGLGAPSWEADTPPARSEGGG